MRRKRYDLLLYAPLFPFVLMLNSIIFFEQFIKRVLFRQKDTSWFKPGRRIITS
jgi:cytochrome b subunit of formate dehydrogenase